MEEMNGQELKELKSELRVSLREYIETKIKALEGKIDVANTIGKEQVASALTSLNARLDTINEFRNAMTDQSKLFLTKIEHEMWRQRVENDFAKYGDKVEEINKSSNTLVTKETFETWKKEVYNKNDIMCKSLENAVTKAELDSWRVDVERRLGDSHDFQLVINAKASQKSVIFSYAISVVAILISLAAIYLRVLGR